MNLNNFIDHTYLKPTVENHHISQLVKEANQYSFEAICISPVMVEFAKEGLNNSKLCSVVGFPSGLSTSLSKEHECRELLEFGCHEIDMVNNVNFIKDKNWKSYSKEIQNLAEICHKKNAALKVILECCYLTNDEILKASELCLKAGADFIKTSTGFGTHGAKIEHIKLMKSIAGNEMKIKASGGIKTKSDAIRFIEAGADRIGTSSGVAIVTE